MMDHNKLRLQVFEKTGIKLDVTDPVFALVALNESLLEETLRRHLAILQKTGLHDAGQLPAGTHPAHQPHADNWESDEAHNAGHTPIDQHDSSVPPASHTPATLPTGPLTKTTLFDRQWLIPAAILAFGSAFLAAVLVLAGLALLRPDTKSAQTNEQNTQLMQTQQKIAKFQKALQKLDPKSQALVQSEIDKP